MREANENVHKNGKSALQDHQESPECQVSEVSESPAVQRDEQTAMCVRGIRKDPLWPWWNVSSTKYAEEDAEGISAQRQGGYPDDTEKKFSVHKTENMFVMVIIDL